MSAAALAAELAAAGHPCRVEAFERLAVLVPHGGHPPDPAALRDAATRLAPRHGFTHVALELLEGAAGTDAGAPLHRG